MALSSHKTEKRHRLMLGKALLYARQEQYDLAENHFEGMLQIYPELCRAWVSYAQVRPCSQRA